MDWKLLLSLLMSLFLWHCKGWVTADDTVGWCLYFRVSCYLTYEVVFKVAGSADPPVGSPVRGETGTQQVSGQHIPGGEIFIFYKGWAIKYEAA